MKSSSAFRNLLIIGGASLLLVSCATDPGTVRYSADEVGQPQVTITGTITSARAVSVSGSGLNAGAGLGAGAGALVGALVGGSKHRALGATLGGVVGAAGGQAVGQKVNTKPGTEYTIRADNGKLYTFVDTGPALQVGQRVLLTLPSGSQKGRLRPYEA